VLYTGRMTAMVAMLLPIGSDGGGDGFEVVEGAVIMVGGAVGGGVEGVPMGLTS
jgi:hypothetical protein